VVAEDAVDINPDALSLPVPMGLVARQNKIE
jgi:hypothetical protein